MSFDFNFRLGGEPYVPESGANVKMVNLVFVTRHLYIEVE
jgi:hypothetical protein